MKKIIILLLLLAWTSNSFSQDVVNKGYRGYINIALGDAYNLNSAQKVSTNNMQLFSMISTTHGYCIKNWFVGAGVGYYHSFRDKENMYPFYAAGRYTFGKVKLNPYIECRAGIMYDPLWIEKVQKYGALSTGVRLYKGIQAGLSASIFSRPSCYFTANAAVVVSYEIGKY